MKIPFSYPNIVPLDIPDANLLAILEPRTIEPTRPIEELVEEALDHPIDSPKNVEIVSPTSQVLILVDDITRQTPAGSLLPAPLRRIIQRGRRTENFKILIAAGTHAKMSPAEVEKKLGREIPRQHSVFIHHWKK